MFRAHRRRRRLSGQKQAVPGPDGLGRSEEMPGALESRQTRQLAPITPAGTQQTPASPKRWLAGPCCKGAWEVALSSSLHRAECRAGQEPPATSPGATGPLPITDASLSFTKHCTESDA